MTAELHPIEKEKVMAYLDGELLPEEAARVAVHLDQCAECEELAAGLRGLSSRMLAWNVEPAPKRVSDAVFAELKKSNAPKARAPMKGMPPVTLAWRNLLRNRWVWAGAGLAGVALCVLTLTPQLGVKKRAFETVPFVASRESTNYVSDSSEAVPRREFNQAMEDRKNSNQLAKEAVDSAEQTPSPAAPSTIAPMIARTASLNISVKEFSAARSAAEKIVKVHGGYISSLSLSTEKGSPQSLAAKLAIPAAQFEATLADLRSLGRVAQEQQSSEEVTSQVIDLDARLKNARETEAQLTEILRARTGKIGDVLEVEKEMARVRGEIEVMTAQQKQLLGRVSFASIDLNLAEEYQAQLGDGPVGAGRQLWNALVDGYHAAADGLLKAFAFLLSVGPSLAILGLIFFWPARWAWRRWRNSRSGVARA
jgi:anti-sigma factor RsiW